MVVSVVRLGDPQESLREAIARCDGFARLNRHGKILLKPNIPTGFRLPPYGMTTTASILVGLVRVLIEQGCHNIIIGEGSIEVLGFGTKRAYARTEIDKLAARYGVTLIDLNDGPFRQVDISGFKIQIAEAVLDADFLINVPVLKTHGQTRVPQGFKNLKGCLSLASRLKFHKTRQLDHCIRLLNEAVRSHLTVIDGTYMLEMGPDTVLGMAWRKDLSSPAGMVLPAMLSGLPSWASILPKSVIFVSSPKHTDYPQTWTRFASKVRVISTSSVNN